MEVKEKVKEFIAYNGLLPKNKSEFKILVAVSGGRDSMLLLNLLHTLGYSVIVAHMNFKLRGDESDGDEAFVVAQSKAIGVQCFVNHVDTNKYADEENISTQMAARALRYNWFDQLCEEMNIDYIATAHHLSDQTETLLINQLRGVGIRGMRGIPIKNNNIIRPMMCLTREQINEYIAKENVAYREDSSNSIDTYLRNAIRQHVIPKLKRIHTGLDITLDRNAGNFESADKWLNDTWLKFKKRNVKPTIGGGLYITWKALKHSPDPHFALYRLMEENGLPLEFSYEAWKTYKAKNFQGKKINYGTAHIGLERKGLYIYSLYKNDYITQWNTDQCKTPWANLNRKLVPTKKIKFDEKEQRIYISSKVNFDLVEVRNWKQGDLIQPLGMKGTKLLSDWFIDKKIANVLKPAYPVVLVDNKVIAVLGVGVSEQFKVESTDKEAWELSIDFGI